MTGSPIGQGTRLLGRLPIAAILFFILAGGGPGAPAAPAEGLSDLKANLDLPFDASGGENNEEEAPPILIFYGQQYEGTAIAFALDSSGSMNENGRWQIQSREVVKAIYELSDRVEFGVVYYSSGVKPFRPTLVSAIAANKSAAIQFVNSTSPQGDTCLGEGTVKALELVRKSTSKQRTVIVTSDGHPDNCGTGNLANAKEMDQIIQQTLSANPGGSIRVHTIWVGQSSEAEAMGFMRRLATAHGGTFRTANH